MEYLKAGAKLGRWRVVRCIGRGAYGCVWTAKDQESEREVALKIELPSIAKTVLRSEYEIAFSLPESVFFPKVYEYGNEHSLNFMSMELLGISVKDYAEKHVNNPIPFCEASRISLSMLRAIQSFHEAGFVHRDVKPANFAFRGKIDCFQVCLIDYGLAKRWRSEQGELLPPRHNVGFRGTIKYASLNAFRGNDLGRVDDLWSLLYTIIELFNVPLPWKSLNDKNSVAQIKERGISRAILGLPPQIESFAARLNAMSFADIPDYNYLAGLLQRVIEIADEENSQDSSYSLMSQYVSTSYRLLSYSGTFTLGSSSMAEGSWNDDHPMGPSAQSTADGDLVAGGGSCCILI